MRGNLRHAPFYIPQFGGCRNSLPSEKVSPQCRVPPRGSEFQQPVRSYASILPRQSTFGPRCSILIFVKKPAFNENTALRLCPPVILNPETLAFA